MFELHRPRGAPGRRWMIWTPSIQSAISPLLAETGSFIFTMTSTHIQRSVLATRLGFWMNVFPQKSPVGLARMSIQYV